MNASFGAFLLKFLKGNYWEKALRGCTCTYFPDVSVENLQPYACISNLLLHVDGTYRAGGREIALLKYVPYRIMILKKSFGARVLFVQFLPHWSNVSITETNWLMAV
jgi:hypothetical protein